MSRVGNNSVSASSSALAGVIAECCVGAAVQARLKTERADKLADKKSKRDEDRRKKYAKKGGSLIVADTNRVKMFG